MQQQERKAVAAEVLEMGEQLFTLALEAQDSPHTTPDEEMQEHVHQAFPHAEIAAASAEFFAALRLLLDITEE
jgi:hypothetical protein